MYAARPFDTHDFQLETITHRSHLLDDNDVLLVTVTGSGKTDTFVRTMHTIQFLSRLRFPKFIHPSGSSKALEEEMLRPRVVHAP